MCWYIGHYHLVKMSHQIKLVSWKRILNFHKIGISVAVTVCIKEIWTCLCEIDHKHQFKIVIYLVVLTMNL